MKAPPSKYSRFTTQRADHHALVAIGEALFLVVPEMRGVADLHEQDFLDVR